jgi:hypothetical protein
MDLDYRETMALAIWGCPDYGMTVMRLANVADLTMDPDMRSIISGLYERLFNEITGADYQKIYKSALDRKQDEKARQLSCQNRKKRRIEALRRARKLGWTVIKGKADEDLYEKGGDKS